MFRHFPKRSRRGGVVRSAIALLTFSSAAGVLGWMLLMPGALEVEIETRTGFPVEAESLAINPFGLSVSGEKVLIGNTDAFGGGDPMLEIAELTGNASLASLSRGEIWIESFELNISTARLVVDERGRLNLDSFSSQLFADPETGEQLPFFAEEVRLVVGELEFVDNSKFIPSRRSLAVRLDQEMNDLEDAREIFEPLRELAQRVGNLPLQ